MRSARRTGHDRGVRTVSDPERPGGPVRNRLGDPQERPDEQDVGRQRPKRFADFVGQGAAKEQLEIFVRGRQAAAARRWTTCCCRDRPGWARPRSPIIANEMGGVGATPLRPGPRAQGGPGRLAHEPAEGRRPVHRRGSTACGRGRGGALPGHGRLRDRHRDRRGPGGPHHPPAVSPFTLIGATTRTGLLTTPLRDRFGVGSVSSTTTAGELTRIVMRGRAGILERRVERTPPARSRALARHAARRQPAAPARARLRAGARRGRR